MAKGSMADVIAQKEGAPLDPLQLPNTVFALAVAAPVPPLATATWPLKLKDTLPRLGLPTVMFVPLCQLMVVCDEVFVPFA
jgi:hypothetical protein